MILKNKHAVIYGAGGSLGGAVARALATEGASVFLTGIHIAPLQKLMDEITFAGGRAWAEQVDATDEEAVSRHFQKIEQEAGQIDISYNAIGIKVVQNIPLVDMSVNDFVNPVSDTMRTQFLTATTAGKHMKQKRSGVILSLTATPGGIGYPYTGGFAPACCALESFSRNLAAELGIDGVRVVNMRSAGSPDSRIFKEAIVSNFKEMDPILQKMKADTMLKKLPLMADIANLAVFLSSDLASMITGVTVDITGGTTAGLNWRVSGN